MLVLSRKIGERIVIGDNITLIVAGIQGDRVRIGVEAPKEVSIHRQEVADAIKRHNEQAGRINTQIDPRRAA